jgi:hypothetical protein
MRRLLLGSDSVSVAAEFYRQRLRLGGGSDGVAATVAATMAVTPAVSRRYQNALTTW